MSAQSIYDQAPIGALIRYSDGTPRPPQRFKNKRAAWENNNNVGRLVRKAESHTVGNHTTPESFTLHQGDFGSAGVVVLKVFKTFSVGSPLIFTLVERPKPGMSIAITRQKRLMAGSALSQSSIGPGLPCTNTTAWVFCWGALS